MFSCEYCETFNNSFFIEHLWLLLLHFPALFVKLSEHLWWGAHLKSWFCYFNQFQSSMEFHIETSYLFCRTKQMTGFYMKRSARLKWFNSDCWDTVLILDQIRFMKLNLLSSMKTGDFDGSTYFILSLKLTSIWGKYQVLCFVSGKVKHELPVASCKFKSTSY